MPCPSQTFSNVTQAQFDCLAQKAASTGISITGPSGEASANGITVTWNFDPATGTLEMQCTDSPFFMPCNMINTKLRETVESCM